MGTKSPQFLPPVSKSLLSARKYDGFMRILASLCAMALSSGCVSQAYEVSGFPYGRADPPVPANATKILISGDIFERLNGRDLTSAVVGNRMFIDSSVITDSGTSHYSGEYFSSDGRTYFWTRFRLGHGKGTYAVHRNSVCTEGDGRGCFALFKSEDGRFVRLGASYTSPHLIVVSPIETDWTPRLN